MQHADKTKFSPPCYDFPLINICSLLGFLKKKSILLFISVTTKMSSMPKNKNKKFNCQTFCLWWQRIFLLALIWELLCFVCSGGLARCCFPWHICQAEWLWLFWSLFTLPTSEPWCSRAWVSSCVGNPLQLRLQLFNSWVEICDFSYSSLKVEWNSGMNTTSPWRSSGL